MMPNYIRFDLLMGELVVNKYNYMHTRNQKRIHINIHTGMIIIIIVIIIMCKKSKFDHMSKWYMHNTAPVLENDTHKLLWDFDIQTDHLISARRPDLIIINKKKKKREFAKLSTLLSRLTTK